MYLVRWHRGTGGWEPISHFEDYTDVHIDDRVIVRVYGRIIHTGGGGRHGGVCGVKFPQQAGLGHTQAILTAGHHLLFGSQSPGGIAFISIDS